MTSLVKLWSPVLALLVIAALVALGVNGRAFSVVAAVVTAGALALHIVEDGRRAVGRCGRWPHRHA